MVISDNLSPIYERNISIRHYVQIYIRPYCMYPTYTSYTPRYGPIHSLVLCAFVSLDHIGQYTIIL